MQLGAALRAARESKGLTIENVCEHFEISEASLKKIETGKVKLEYWLVKEFEAFYAVKIDDFLGDLPALP